MQVIHSKDVLMIPKEELYLSLPDSFPLVFEDGVTISTNKRKLVYSHVFWRFHREYPATPLLSTHYVENVLKGKSLTDNTHVALLDIIYQCVIDTYKIVMPIDKEPLLSIIYEVVNEIHNDISKLTEEYVTSIDILDFIEVMDHPVIKHAVDNVQPTPQSIDEVYKTTLAVMKDDESLKTNPLVMSMRSGTVSANQVLQCVAVRGFVAEVDGTILSKPVISNYAKGLGNLYEFVADSRGAARAAYMSESPLEDAEYFARRLQLLSMTVERIDYMDCGTTKLVPWRVKGPEKDEKGQVTYHGDLIYMLGKHYVHNGVHGTITKDDPSLHGEVIHLRSLLYCKHPDRHTVCSVCFGELSGNVSRFQNLGHLSSSTMTQQTSQSVLSTKHLLVSSVSACIYLTDTARKFFSVNKDRNQYLVNESMRKPGTRLVISKEEAIGLIDILNIPDVSRINPGRVSSIEVVEVMYEEKGFVLSIPIEVSYGKRRAILTSEFLKYLKKKGWETDAKTNFVFNLDEWDFSLPVLRLPDMEYSYSDHGHQIAKMIESSMEKINERSSPESPISTLQEVFSLVNSKLSVNIAALEVIIYASMLPGRDSYNLARGAEDPVLGISSLMIKNRSLSAAYAFQGQSETLCNPRSFFQEDRPDSTMDVFIAPEEVVKQYQGLNR